MSATRIPSHAATARRAQRGLSLIGLLVTGVLIAFAALLALKVVPSALEYNAIRSALAKVASAGGNSARDYQVAFDRFAAVDDITSISGKDLIVERRPDGQTVVSFQYEKRIPLFGPVSLVIDYRGSSQ
ncbi:MAG: DUF4845 domain-containing protein [Burkholderiaceae bacterium]|nr:DUF4845 domain-containing protein [Burkholderiaceae bacterium]